MTAEPLTRSKEFWRARLADLRLEPLPFGLPGEPGDAELPPCTHTVPAPGRTSTPGGAGSLLAAAVGIVMARSTGASDVCLATSDDRVSLAGPADPLPLRFAVRADAVGPWLSRLAAEMREARAHPVPFADVREWSAMPAWAPECLVDLASQDGDGAGSHQSSPFPLVVRLRDRLVVEHLGSRFDHEDVVRFAGHVAAAMSAIIDEPDRPAVDVPILGDDERQALMAWSVTDVPPDPGPWSHAFDDSCVVNAGAVAVSEAGTSTTYRELDGISAGIADRLRASHIGPGDIVAVAIPSSAIAFAALAGILRAGAAYTAITGADPVARNEFILRNSGARAVLARNGDVEWLPTHSGVETLVIDAKDETRGLRSTASSSRPRAGSDPAYVTYTSGTTGTPKGVVTTARNLGHYARQTMAWYGIDRSDVVLNFASLSFDFSVAEIFPALHAGATLVPHDERFHGTGAQFWDACEQEGVTVLMLPTSFWAEVATEILGGRPVPERIRLVSIGGERAAPESVARWLERTKGLTLVNGYGPTETTVEATRSVLSERSWEDDPPWRREVPIGRPIPGSRVFVLDRMSVRPQLAPVGVAGELIIAGTGVTAGYLSDPERTERAFVVDPIEGEGRAFRTGDLGRFLPNGEIEFLGRSDRQLKVRGFRVEPGEIESVLEQHPQIRHAAVGGVESVGGDVRLVAFVLVGDIPPSDLELKEHVGRRLPAHMIPSVISAVDRVPLLPNGKTDYAAISATVGPSASLPTLGPTEARLASIWETLLQVQGIRGKDDFFELGGHSILAMRLAAQIDRELGVTLTLEEIFDNPSLESLAGAIDAGRSTET